MMAVVTTITMSGSVKYGSPADSRPGAMGLDTTSASGTAPATHQINGAVHRSRCASVALVAVVAADVDPLQSIWRPGSAPAAVVGGVGKGHANERKAVEAVVEEAVVSEREPRREPSMGKMRTREVATAEMRASTHAANMHAAAHAAAMHPSSHSTDMHPSSHAATM